MVVFEDVGLELFELLVAKWAAVVTIYSLLNAGFAIYMAAARYVTVVDGVQTDCALELSL